MKAYFLLYSMWWNSWFVPVPYVSLSGTRVYFCGHEAGQCYVCTSARHADCTKAKVYGQICIQSPGVNGGELCAETHLPTS
jgi:hypothetical protein